MRSLFITLILLFISLSQSKGKMSNVEINKSISAKILDNNPALTENLIITGVFDAQPGFAGTKGAEFFALNDIPDLSIYGVGVVNNGNGSDGIEYTFPAQSLAAGEFIYLVEDSTEFADYFGQSTSFVFPAININGNDALELFGNGQPLDVFGEVDMDGTGTGWEYTDGWAYRKQATGPDGSNFVQGRWNYGGVDALDGHATNDLASVPFPIGTYSGMFPTEVIARDDAFTFGLSIIGFEIDVLNNDQTPPGYIEFRIFDATPDISIYPTDINSLFIEPDDDNFCGVIEFGYSISIGTSSDSARVVLDIVCPTEFQLLEIGEVNKENTNGTADSFGTRCELIGTVYGVNLSDDGLYFTIIDNSGEGIAVFRNNTNLPYTVREGDEVRVQGTIWQSRGVTEINAFDIELLSEGNPLFEPRAVTNLGEETESNLIIFENVSYVDISQWGGGESGFNFLVTDGYDEFEVRIDNNVDLFLLPAPGDAGTLMQIIGIGGQDDNSLPLDEGYQLIPRYESDIQPTFYVDNTLEVLASRVDMFPNPTNKSLHINSEESLDMVRVVDALGKVVFEQEDPLKELTIQVGNYTKGAYSVEAIKDNAHLTMMLIVQ